MAYLLHQNHLIESIDMSAYLGCVMYFIYCYCETIIYVKIYDQFILYLF